MITGAVMMTGVMSRPGPDRPQKQADYAALSHPANTRTVMARTTLTDPVPLHQDQHSKYAPAAQGYYGGGHPGYYY